MTRVVATSDFHGTFPQEIMDCDLLLIAGDVCPVKNHNLDFQYNWLHNEFKEWLHDQFVPPERIVWVGGNHDFILEHLTKEDIASIGGVYLENESTVINLNGRHLMIYGSPMSPKFGKWAFMADDNYLSMVWEGIPDGVDIIMTHTPMHDVLDYARIFSKEHVGSKTLRKRIVEGNFHRLKLHVCGHIHEDNGVATVKTDTKEFVSANVSFMDGHYNPINLPMVFDL